MPTRIIIVEDEPLTRATIAQFLKGEGYQVREAADTCAFRAAFQSEPADLVILDLGLPGSDGLTLAQELKDNDAVEVIVVTARAAPEDRILALDLGADDYLVKPVHFGELAARIRARLRRRPDHAVIQFGAWRLDHGRRLIIAEDRAEISLSRGEYDLLVQLIAADGKIVLRDVLARTIARDGVGDVRSVDALVSRLRRKLDNRDIIATAPGFGYRLSAPAAPVEGAA